MTFLVSYLNERLSLIIFKFKKQIKNLDVKRELKSFEEEYKKKISNIGQAK